VRYLLDTHVVLAIIWRDVESRYPRWAELLADPSNCAVSTASLWEISIKTQAQKLDPQIPLNKIEGYLAALGFAILPILASHATAQAQPEPATRDPFDRALLAIAQLEGLRFVTADRSLAGHPATLA
jgi:PIN domain nuclease of toxin-antitoxin system